MTNTLTLRLLMVAIIMATTIAGFLAFAFMKFPKNLAVIIPSILLCIGGVWLIKRKEKAARFDIYYSTVKEFGTPLSFSNANAAFERNGTRFDVEFPKNEDACFFKVNFYVPNIKEKFSVQNRTLAVFYDEDCQAIQNSPLPQEYLLQSRNPEFLLKFLEIREIRNEVLNYKASFFGRILFSFTDGNFEMIWTPPISQQIAGFYQICQSAVVFHDELKKLR